MYITGNVSEVYYFDITKVVDNDGSKTYTVANECKGTKISNVSMGKYDALYSEAHQLLMVIQLQVLLFTVPLPHRVMQNSPSRQVTLLLRNLH